MLPKRERDVPLPETSDMVLLLLPQGNFNPLGLARTSNTRDGARTAVQVHKPHRQVPEEKMTNPRSEACRRFGKWRRGSGSERDGHGGPDIGVEDG